MSNVSEEIIDGGCKLNVQGMSMKDDDWRSLIEKMNNKECPLRELVLSFESFSDDEPATSQFIEFAKVVGAHPTLIKFRYNGGIKSSDNTEQAVLLKELSKNRSIKHLSLVVDNFNEDANRALSETLNNNQTLICLDIHVTEYYEPITQDTLSELSRSIQTTVLEHLSIRRFDDEGFEVLMQHLPPTLTCLDLRENSITDEIFPALESFMKTNHTLKQLILGEYLAMLYLLENGTGASNMLNVVSASSILGILASKEYNLDLSTSEINDNDWAVLVDTLTKGNHPCRHLKLTIHDEISSTHLKQLLTILQSEQCQLKEMELTYEKLDKVKQINLFYALSKNKSIKNIFFDYCKIDSDVFRLLFTGRSDKSPITHLRINQALDIGDEEAIVLAQCLEEKTNFQELVMDSTCIGDKGYQELLNCLPSSLNTLILGDTLITATSLPATLSFVKKHPQLKKLSLYQNGISTATKEVNVLDIIEEICKVGKDIDCEYTVQLNDTVKNTICELQIVRIDLSRENLRDDHILELYNALKVQSNDTNRKWSINLAGNTRISSIGIQHLTNILPTLSIDTLSLACCEMNGENLKILCTGLDKNNTLKTLDISGNGLDTRGIKHITRYLQNNTTLNNLDLSSNKLNVDHAVRLASVLSKTQLTELDLSGNAIRDRGCPSILSSLPTSLIKLKLDYNVVTKSSLDTIIQFLSANQTLEELHIRGNPIFQENDDSEETDGCLNQAKKAAEKNNICELY